MATRGNGSSKRQQRAGTRAGRRGPRTAAPGARERARRPADEARSAQEELLQGVQQVWLAGMGAIARAQKDGPAAFSDAVLEGLRLLNRSRSTAQRVVRDAFENAQVTLQSRVGDARSQAQGTWDSLESLFQSRVQRAMHQLGVPTAEDIRLLTRRVAELNENVERINVRARAGRGTTGARRRVGARKTRARKGAARTPAAE
jgi:poly(hydroxyalkanoate) granule-associated protein